MIYFYNLNFTLNSKHVSMKWFIDGLSLKLKFANFEIDQERTKILISLKSR